MKDIKVGLIGAGRIGKLHAENLTTHIPHVELVALADTKPTLAKRVADDFNIPYYFDDYHQIIDHPEIDAVIICSPTNTHAQIIQETSSAGKHVFCEKPIDFDLDRTQKTLESVKKNGIKFQVGFNRRFDTNFQSLESRILKGEIGDLHILRITSRDPAPPPISYIEVSGGIFLDMMIHDFDMARYLVKNEVVQVYAAGGVMIDKAIGEAGDIDTATVILKFANGVLGTIDNSRQAVYGYDQRIEVFGSNGMIRAENVETDTCILSNAKGSHQPPLPHFFLDRYKSSYLTEMVKFLHCIENDTIPEVVGNDGLKAIQIALAAKESYLMNRPIEIKHTM